MCYRDKELLFETHPFFLLTFFLLPEASGFNLMPIVILNVLLLLIPPSLVQAIVLLRLSLVGAVHSAS